MTLIDHTEKLPRDVLTMLLRHVFLATAVRCSHCRYPLLFEVQNVHLRACKRVSRRWRQCWNGLLSWVLGRQRYMCTRPVSCVKSYLKLNRLPIGIHVLEELEARQAVAEIMTNNLRY